MAEEDTSPTPLEVITKKYGSQAAAQGRTVNGVVYTPGAISQMMKDAAAKKVKTAAPAKAVP